jgi:hypothetical protein
MYPYLTEQLAAQRQIELREHTARRAGYRQAQQAHRMRRAGAAASHGRSHPVRRRAGHALISIGLRLAYAAGED